jgi:hypothetical protein
MRHLTSGPRLAILAAPLNPCHDARNTVTLPLALPSRYQRAYLYREEELPRRVAAGFSDAISLLLIDRLIGSAGNSHP